MIEVFKTDVSSRDNAQTLIERIHERFDHCEANFDLEDCDRILRVKGIRTATEVFIILNLVREMGCDAQILPDDYPSFDNLLLANNEDGTAVEI
jgi:hypothetical protein